MPEKVNDTNHALVQLNCLLKGQVRESCTGGVWRGHIDDEQVCKRRKLPNACAEVLRCVLCQLVLPEVYREYFAAVGDAFVAACCVSLQPCGRALCTEAVEAIAVDNRTVCAEAKATGGRVPRLRQWRDGAWTTEEDVGRLQTNMSQKPYVFALVV
jgi:hypothetical protein